MPQTESLLTVTESTKTNKKEMKLPLPLKTNDCFRVCVKQQSQMLSISTQRYLLYLHLGVTL